MGKSDKVVTVNGGEHRMTVSVGTFDIWGKETLRISRERAWDTRLQKSSAGLQPHNRNL